MKREHLNPRRPSRTFSFEHPTVAGAMQKYHATVGYYADGRPGELFLNSSQRSGTDVDLSVSEAAIAVSLALQHGCDVTTLRTACLRLSDGSPSTPVGRALDIMDEEKPLPERKIVRLI